MITGKTLMAFIRQASKTYSNKDSCVDFLGTDVRNFSQAICLLFNAFDFQMSNIGFLPHKKTVFEKCLSFSELKEKNRSVLNYIRENSFRLFSKSEYNFGICFLYLYYFQRILDNYLPKDLNNFINDNENEETVVFPRRLTQEEVVILLTGSKDRSHIHETLPVVCSDLAEIMNRQLKIENPRFQKLLKILSNHPSRRSFTLIKGIKGSGKSEFLHFLDEAGLIVRDYHQGTVNSLDDFILWIQSSILNNPVSSEKRSYITLDNFDTFSIGEIYSLAKAIEDIPEEESFHLICTSRNRVQKKLYKKIFSKFNCQSLDLPMMDVESVSNLLVQEKLALDPSKILTETLGYPPLVNYCISHHTDTIPKSIYIKTIMMIFETKTSEELIRTWLFIILIKNGIFNESSLSFHSDFEKKHLFDWQPFIQKAVNNGLLNESPEQGKWIPIPFVLFLSEKILHMQF